ncbi:MAG TPA: hypothetical protein VGH70_17520 [Bradyrhizobium sp.]|jgi:hypothetical protein
MKRRDYITALGGAVAGPAMARAQLKKVPRIGVLWQVANAETTDDDGKP